MAPARVILMSCGSYNPPTNMHLRMFEIARDHLHRMGTHVVVGGVISPVHDAYAKKELASATHRCSMLRLALQNSDWIRLSTWETRQNCWTKTRLSLQHHQNLLNSILSNSNDIKHHLQIEDTEWIPENVKNNSDNTPIQIKLLCGADLLESFGIYGLWLEEDIDTIVGEHGLVVITREGSNPNKFIYDSDILSKHMHNICIVTEWIPNEVSSTRIRRALKRSESVRYLLQDSVIDYIYKHEIYDARAPDTTIKLELPSPNANNYLHIDPRYLTAFLTPSPSDVTMDSPSPVEIAASIDVPDAVLRKNRQNASGGAGLDEAREQFISSVIDSITDNGNVKHVARAAYPGQAKQIIASGTGVSRILDEVGAPGDEPRPGPSSVDDGATGRAEIGQSSDFRFKTEIVDVYLDARDDREKIRSGSSEVASSSGRSLIVGSAARSKAEVERREALDLSPRTEIIDVDLGLRDDREIIVKVQPGPSSELASKQARRLILEGSARGKTDVRQREVSKSKTEIAVIDIGSNDDREIIMTIQPGQPTHGELRLGECCWPTRESTAANNRVDVRDRKIISEKKIIDARLSPDDKSAREEHESMVDVIGDDVDWDRPSFSRSGSEKNSRLSAKSIAKEKIDSKEINIKKMDVDADVVKIQPVHSSHSIITLKESRRTRSRENLESGKMDKNDTERTELGSETILSYNVEVGDAGTSSGKKIDFELDVIRHPEAKVTSPPLDGRHECALSDFSVDREDYRLSQYNSEDERDERKPAYTARSSFMKHAGERDDTIDNTTDFVNDDEIGKNAVQLHSSQVLVSAVIHKSREEEPECFITRETDSRTKFSEEPDRSKVIAERSIPETEIDDKINVASGERTEKVSGIDRAGGAGKESEFDRCSSEKRTASCEASLEIDGKYLKSIVNSRKSPRKVREDQIRDIEIKSEISRSSSLKTKTSEKIKREEIRDMDIEKKDQTADDRKASRAERVSKGCLRSSSAKVKGSRKVEELQADGSEFKDQDSSVSDREMFRVEKVFQSSSQPASRSASAKSRSSRKAEALRAAESEREFKSQDKSISDQDTSRSEKSSQKSLRASSARSPKKVKKNLYRSEMKDYDRAINDRVISQLEEVFHQDTTKKFTVKTESPKRGAAESHVEPKKSGRSADSREVSRSDEPAQHLSKTSSTKSPKRTQEQKIVRLSDDKGQQKQEKMRLAQSADNRASKCDFNEIKDVYTRKVRRYNVPLQGSLDSMIVSEETAAQKPKKDDAFSKKSKSYESIKRIQEVFLGVPSSKANSSASQLDIPDEFCSICCYMNDITFRTEEEVSSPQETFYTLRSTCSSLADDDDDSIECDICGTLNLQEPSADELDGKEIPCELCRICGEVDGSYEQDPALADRYGFRMTGDDPRHDDDDSFEIENCGFQSGTESADDRGKVPGKERTKDPGRPKSQSLFIHGTSMTRDQPRELYFIPKDEIAILTYGTRKVGRKGSLFRKKEDHGKSARDNRRYSSVDSLQLAKMSPKAGDKQLKAAKNATLIKSADNLQISEDSARSKFLQKSVDDVGRLNQSSDNLDSPAAEKQGKEAETEESGQAPNARDKEAVKMILTQHGIKIISEKETAL